MSDQPSQAQEISTPSEPLRRRWLGRMLTTAIWCGLVLVTAWAVAALHFDVRIPWLREPMAVAYAAGVLAIWVFVKLMSFGFEGGDYVCFSIETRKEKGEDYSAIKGLFRQFELIYVVGDERDLVRLRTNYRTGEDAYLYRLRASPAMARAFFLDYLRRVNDLHQRPQWYSALTHNFTTSIRTQRAAADRSPWNWRMLVNGYGDEMLYERGTIATNLPFAEMKPRCLINERARAADKADNFSQRIRQGVPGIQPEI